MAQIGVHFTQPFGVEVEELVHQGAEKLRGGKFAANFRFILREALSDDGFQRSAHIYKEHVEFHHRSIDELARFLTEGVETHVEQIAVEPVFKSLGGQKTAHSIEEFPIIHTGKLQRGHSAHQFHQVCRIVLVAHIAGVVVVGNRRRLVAQIKECVHIALVGVGERFVVVLQRALRFHHKVGFIDALILAIVEVEVRQHGESADGSHPQEVFVAHIQILRLTNVFHQDRESGSSGAAENAADEENAVAFGKHIGKGFKFFAIFNHVERHRANVGRAHKADIHFVFQLVVGKEQRSERLVGLIHRVVVDELAKFGLSHRFHIEHKGVGDGGAGHSHNRAQGADFHTEETVAIHIVSVEFFADNAVCREHLLGALEVFVTFVRVDNHGHNFHIVHGASVAVEGLHPRCREHNQRLQHARPCSAYSKNK